MADVLTPEQRRLNMSRIRGRDTKPEKVLRSALHARGLRFRLHRPDLPGRPDIVFPSARLAVFVDGCFWHGCPEHGVRPTTNAEFWTAKLRRNAERDAKVADELTAGGWSFLRFWEHELKRELPSVVDKIASQLSRSSR